MWPYIVIGTFMMFAGMIIARTILRNQDKLNELKEENERLKEGKDDER